MRCELTSRVFSNMRDMTVWLLDLLIFIAYWIHGSNYKYLKSWTFCVNDNQRYKNSSQLYKLNAWIIRDVLFVLSFAEIRFPFIRSLYSVYQEVTSGWIRFLALEAVSVLAKAWLWDVYCPKTSFTVIEWCLKQTNYAYQRRNENRDCKRIWKDNIYNAVFSMRRGWNTKKNKRKWFRAY